MSNDELANEGQSLPAIETVRNDEGGTDARIPPKPPVIETVRRGNGGEKRRRSIRAIVISVVTVAVAIAVTLGIRAGLKKAAKPMSERARPATERTPPRLGMSRSFVRDHIRENDNCRVVSLTKRNGDVVVCGRNNWASEGCPQDMNEALQNATDDSEKIMDVTVTEDGQWLVLWGRNAGAWRGIPTALEHTLREFNRNNEEIYSATFNDAGEWIAISEKHYNASDSIKEWLKEGAQKYGILRAACLTDDAAVAVFDDGYKFIGPVPEDLKFALRKSKLDVRIVKIAGFAWFFADQYGRYQYNM